MVTYSFHSLLFYSKYLETPWECPYKLYKRANCSSLHFFSSGLGTGKGSVKLQNYKTQVSKTLQSNTQQIIQATQSIKANTQRNFADKIITQKIDMGAQKYMYELDTNNNLVTWILIFGFENKECTNS
jgi:hypothetical protein